VYLSHSLQEVVAHAQCIGDDGQGRIHRTAGREETAIDDIQIVHIMSLAVGIQSRGLRIVTEANRAILMGNAAERNAFVDKEILREQPLVAGVAVDRAFRLLFHQALEFGY